MKKTRFNVPAGRVARHVLLAAVLLLGFSAVPSLLPGAFPGGAALAREAEPVAADAALEKRAMNLAQQLRCLVCQNQTIADSNADLANDLREQIRVMLRQGATDDQIRAYMVQRYGDFVLYKPPVKSTTLFLWSAPMFLLLIGFGVLVMVQKRRAAAPDDPAAPPDPADDADGASGDAHP